MELIRFINQTFWGTSGYAALFALALCIIFLEKEGEARGKWMGWYSVAVFVLVICNPVIGAVATKTFMADDTYAYLRIFYVLPLMSVIAYGAACFYVKEASPQVPHWKKGLLALLIGITIIISGKLYDGSTYVKAENLYKISQQAIEIYDIIMEDCGGVQTRALLPNEEEIAYGIRQYTDDIIIAAYSDAFTDVDGLLTLEQEKDFSYVVIPKEIGKMAVLEDGGYTLAGETYGYFVFRK